MTPDQTIPAFDPMRRVLEMQEDDALKARAKIVDEKWRELDKREESIRAQEDVILETELPPDAVVSVSFVAQSRATRHAEACRKELEQSTKDHFPLYLDRDNLFSE